MKLLNQINAIFRNYLPYVVLTAAGLAMTSPTYFTWMTGIVTYLLQFIMFTMGLTMTFADFRQVLKQPLKIICIELAQYLAMPLFGFLLAKALHLPDQVALGLILVGSVPGGTSSNVITYLANGDVPLSIAATSVSTLAAPFLTPLMLSLYGGAYLDIAFWPMFVSITKVVLVPVLGGLLLNLLFGTYTRKVETVLPTFSSVAVLMVLMGTVAVNRETLLTSGLVIFLAVALHNVSGYLLGYLVGYLLKLDRSETRAVAIEIGLQNTGLAASLGLAHFSPLAAVAGAAGTVVHTLIGSIFASLCAYHDRKVLEGANIHPSLAKIFALLSPASDPS